MELSAYVKDKETKKPTVIRSEYPTKEKFAVDLRRNGYTVIRISNKRDLAAQDYGYSSFSEMKRKCMNEDHIKEVSKIKV